MPHDSPKSNGGLIIGLAVAGGVLIAILLGSLNHQKDSAIHPPATAPATSPTAAGVEEFFVVNSIGMTFYSVSPGEFMMGSPPDEKGRDIDETQHKVRITKPFLLAIHPVTQRQYLAVMGTNPSYFRGEDFPERIRGDLPVDSVSWDDAMEFCKKLGEMEKAKYRLPTEAEREYVCRAGSTGPYARAAQLDDIGWYLINSGDTTHPVGQLQPNEWGFYDMQGNVWEWCADWYGEYPKGDAVDPTGPATGKMRVLRGGAVGYDMENARAAFRNSYLPDSRVYHNGFRVVMDVP